MVVAEIILVDIWFKLEREPKVGHSEALFRAPPFRKLTLKVIRCFRHSYRKPLSLIRVCSYIAVTPLRKIKRVRSSIIDA